ncbi:MAG: hypothetical protein O7H41_17970 [Planctomycetota bacterium]|nr:hypothetical protein [Planctomycetota bacterium]
MMFALPACLLLGGCPDGGSSKRGNSRVEVLLTGLEDPWGIAFQPSGDLIIVTYSGTGSLVRQVKDLGLPTQTITMDGRVFTPSCVAVCSNGNFVPPCDMPNVTDLFDGVDITATFIDRNTPADALVEDPTGICASGTDTDPWYLVQSSTGDLVELLFNNLGDQTDNTVSTIAPGIITRIPEAPTHLAYLAGTVYAVDTGGDRLLAIDPGTGATTVLAGSAAGLDRPAALAVTTGGSLLVGNFGNGKLLEFSTFGVLIRTIETGVGANRLRAIAVDSSGEIYLAYATFATPDGRVARLK